jgi:UDP-glucose 4-epimerase
MLSAGTNCLVTGGAGFIGSHLVDKLVEMGCRVRVLDNLSTGNMENLGESTRAIEFIGADLRDESVCQAAVRDMEVIFHLAALPSVARSMEDPWGTHETNVNGTMHLLLAAREHGVRRIVFSSSSSVYGDTPTLPKIESVEPLPRSPYAVSKLTGEQYVCAFARAQMLEGVALRYFNIFGPRQDPNSAYAAVIAAFVQAGLVNTSVEIFGDGGQTRDFTYVENAVQANLLAASGPVEQVSGQVVNVGAGARTSLLQLLSMIRDACQADIPARHAAPRPGDVRDSLASLDRVREVLGYEPTVSLKDGLEKTVAWMRDHLPHAARPIEVHR